MKLTVVKMSYLVFGKSVSITVKSDGADFETYIDGIPAGVFASLDEAIVSAIAECQWKF